MKAATRQTVENLWISRSGERTKLYGKGLQWRARYVDTAGREHTKRFEHKRDAKEWLNQITRSGEDIAPQVQGVWTLRDQFTAWIRRAHVAETTKATRRHTWRRHIEPRWGNAQVTEVEPAAVKAWVADLAESDEVGVATIENALGVLRMVLEDAVSDRRLIRNPCDGVKAPRRGPSKKQRRTCYLTHEQVEDLARATGEDAAIVRLLAYSGIRWGELAALTVAAVDLKRLRMTIDRAVAEADGKLVSKTPKDHESRQVPLSPFLADELKPRLAGKGSADLVFTAPEGGVLRLSLWRPRVFNKARDGLKGFPRITPHDLRHTCASLVASETNNVLALARMLGHEDASITLRVYADLFDSDLDALGDALDKARTRALKQPTTANDDTESAGKNVPGTQKP